MPELAAENIQLAEVTNKSPRQPSENEGMAAPAFINTDSERESRDKHDK